MKGLVTSRRGAVAAEFALVTPILLTLLMGGFEYGFMAYSMSAMQFGANVVARDIAVNNLSRAEAENRLVAYLPSWMSDDVDMSLTESNPTDPRLNSVTIEVEVPSTSATPIAMVSRLYPWTISASANVRQELPYVD